MLTKPISAINVLLHLYNKYYKFLKLRKLGGMSKITPESRGKTNKKSFFFNWKNVIQKRKKRE